MIPAPSQNLCRPRALSLDHSPRKSRPGRPGHRHLAIPVAPGPRAVHMINARTVARMPTITSKSQKPIQGAPANRWVLHSAGSSR
jgi:hypothetical protein